VVTARPALPTRITSEARGDGWITVRIDRGRVRVFNIATDEVPLLLAELGKYAQPVTVTRREVRDD
jgi:hypothetical protein